MIKFLRQVFDIISKKDKFRLVIILIMILISSFFDLIGVSIIIPIVSILSSPTIDTAIDENLLLKILSNIINTRDAHTLAIAALLSIVIIYLIKIAYAFLLTYAHTKFTLSFNRRLRGKLMSVYLAMPYEYHHENNSSTLIRKSTYDVDVFCSAVSGFITFLAKAATSLVIIIYLFITSYIVTLITSSFLIIFALITVFVLKRKNRTIGRKIQILQSNNYKYLSQAFNGIKESKICNNEAFFINKYISNIYSINELSLKKSIYSAIPGHAIEFVGILGIVISLLVMISIGNEEKYHIISMFAVFAYAVIKLLPCVTEITAYINNFAFYTSSVETLHKDLDTLKEREWMIETYTNYKKMPFNDAIKIQNVSFSYKDDRNKNILHNVSFLIKKNSSVAISGSSGAGKTTLIDIILGLLKPTEGNVLCDDTNIHQNIHGWRDNISYIPQNIYLTDDTIRNNVAFGLDEKDIDEKRVWDSLEKAQLKGFVENSPDGLNTIIGERGIRLSGGQRQRIGIARAFYRNTNIIVFDEATSALDYETEKNILNHVTEYSKNHTLIIITHRLNTIESCDFIYLVENGQLTLKKAK